MNAHIATLIDVETLERRDYDLSDVTQMFAYLNALAGFVVERDWSLSEDLAEEGN